MLHCIALMTADVRDFTTEAASWTLRDYVSPGLRVVRPDTCFPRMRAGDSLHHPWKYLRRDVPHIWYADERYPLMGFLNRDEATLLHNIALQFAGKPALEIGSWLGWSTAHLALGGVALDVIDPAHDDPSFLATVKESLACCGVLDRVNLAGGSSPDAIATLARRDRKWSLFFIDGDHEAPSPARDTLACLPYAADDCAFVFHDLASPAVAAGLRTLADKGFHVVVYQTAQIMGMAWRGDVIPVAHVPDPEVAWQMPLHLEGLPVSGAGFTAPQHSQFKSVGQTFLSAGQTEMSGPHVCIVSSEIIGPFKNGGIGTSMTGLAELLASEGLRVTVLYTGVVWTPDLRLDRWREHYAKRGIDLVAITIDDMKSIAGPVKDCGFAIPWLVYDYLSKHHFDVVHFNDCGGEGSLAIAAKKLGLAFADSLLVVALHSPSRWILEMNHVLPSAMVLSAFQYAEQLSVAQADVVWCPSRYLLEWASQHDFALPPQTFVQQYALPAPRASANEYGRTAPPKEIVFFGRLEERKGLRVFCNAIHLLRDELAARNITVTFMGKPQRCAGMPSADYIAARAKEWRFPVRTITDLGQPEALAMLASGDKLAVMPSPTDNSPCTVYEALMSRIPFLAARTGGIPELVDAADRDRVLFDYTTESLRHALHDAIEHGGWIAKLAVPQEETRRGWIAMHANWRALSSGGPPPVAKEATVAVIIDHPAGARLHATMSSLGLPGVNRFIVLNRGGDALPIENINLMSDDDDALEMALQSIAEDLVLLIHSGVSVDAKKFKAMTQSLASSDAVGVVPAGRLTSVRGSRVIPPLGGSAVFGLFEGVTFTGAMLVKRDALLEARKGRAFAAESAFLGLADLCVTHTDRIWPYADVVVERGADCVVESRSSLPARVAAYGDASPIDRYYMLATGYAATRDRGGMTKRRIALAAVDLGLAPFVRLGSRILRRLRRRA